MRTNTGIMDNGKSRLHIHNKVQCPCCGYMHNSSAKITNNRPNGLDSGDFGVCFECATIIRIMVVNKTLQARIPTDQEMASIAIHQPQLLKALMEGVAIIKAMKNNGTETKP